MAPQSEWPQTTMSRTPSAETAYSMVAETSSPRLDRGAMLPAFLQTKSSPGPDWVIHSSDTRESEQAIKSASGFLAGSEPCEQFPVGRKHVSLKLLNSLNDSVHVFL